MATRPPACRRSETGVIFQILHGKKSGAHALRHSPFFTNAGHAYGRISFRRSFLTFLRRVADGALEPAFQLHQHQGVAGDRLAHLDVDAGRRPFRLGRADRF